MFGSLFYPFLRFLNVAVPQGSSITNATITVNVVSVDGSPDTTFYGVKVADAPAFADPGNMPSSAARTTASADPDPASTGSKVITVTAIVQELVDQALWASGNAMAFVGESNISTGVNAWYGEAYDAAGTAEAVLDIEFEESIALGAPADVEFEGTVSTFTAQVLVGAPGDIQFEGFGSTFTMQVLAGAPVDIQFEGTASTYIIVTPIAAGAPAEITWQGFTSTIATVDMVVEVSLSNFAADTDAEAGVTFRLGNATNFLAAYVDDGDNLVHLSKFEAGVETSIATAAWTPADTAEIRVICQGDRIRVWLDHILRIDATDSTYLTPNRAGPFSRSTTVVKFGPFYAQLLSEVA